MSEAAPDLVMTRAEFFAWVPPDDRRYEFDGFRPVAMRKDWAVPTIQRYVILETWGRALQMMVRIPGTAFWEATALVADDFLRMPELGTEIPVAEFYEDIEFPKDGRWPPVSENDED